MDRGRVLGKFNKFEENGNGLRTNSDGYKDAELTSDLKDLHHSVDIKKEIPILDYQQDSKEAIYLLNYESFSALLELRGIGTYLSRLLPTTTQEILRRSRSHKAHLRVICGRGGHFSDVWPEQLDPLRDWDRNRFRQINPVPARVVLRQIGSEEERVEEEDGVEEEEREVERVEEEERVEDEERVEEEAGGARWLQCCSSLRARLRRRREH